MVHRMLLALGCLVCVATSVSADDTGSLAIVKPAVTETGRAGAASRGEVAALSRRYLVEGQLALGGATHDDLDFSTAWSVAGGVRVLPRTYLVGRLRHTSPFRGSIYEDLLVEWIFDSESASLDPGPPRTHQTELGVGVRTGFRRLWAESTIGGLLLYQVGGSPDFNNRGIWVVNGTLGVELTQRSKATDTFSSSLFATTTFDALDGDLLKVIVGFTITELL